MTDQPKSPAAETTNWAHERTLLAKERTYAAMVRTALSFIGFGIAVAKLIPDLRPVWIADTVGFLLIGGGVYTIWKGSRMAQDVITKLRAEGVPEARWFVTITTLLLFVTSIVGLLIIGLD